MHRSKEPEISVNEKVDGGDHFEMNPTGRDILNSSLFIITGDNLNVFY